MRLLPSTARGAVLAAFEPRRPVAPVVRVEQGYSAFENVGRGKEEQHPFPDE